MNQPFDWAIFGAGIAGASLAWRLAAHGRVLLVEREAQPGMHSTGRSAALFMESYGPPGVRALTRASHAFYEQPPADFGARIITPRGVLYVAEPGQEPLLSTLFEELRAVCPGLQRLTGGEACARVPVLRPERVAQALFDPGAQDIDVHTLLQGFLRGFKRQGGTLMNSATLTRARRVNDVWQLGFGAAQAHASSVINATGAWADEFASLCGVAALGLEPRRRSAFTFAAPPGVDARAWPCVAAADESFYFKPDAGQLLGSPANADPVAAHDVQPEEIDIATGIDRIATATHMTIRRPLATWAGLRTFAPDGELVIGFDPNAPGFFWLTGQGGYGIQSAAGASELAAALLLQAPLTDTLCAAGVNPAVFSPSRFPPA